MKPITLRMMEALADRMVLDKECVIYLQNMRNGYEGECEFGVLMESLKSPHLLLHDLYFEPKFSGAIQIDFLLLIGNSIIVYEVKNYSGVWTYGEEVYRQGNMERSNPLIQLARTKNNFKILLREMGYSHITVEAVVLHIGKNFTLLQAPDNRNVVLPTQISDHLAKLNSYQYPISEQLANLAQVLPKRTMDPPPFTKMIPEYSFEALRKGLRCEQCGELAVRFSQRIYHCQSCNYKGRNRTAIKSAIDEFKLLFPDQVLSGFTLSKWCDGTISPSHCRKILRK